LIEWPEGYGRTSIHTKFDFIGPFSLPKNGFSSTSIIENGELYSTTMAYLPGLVKFKNLRGEKKVVPRE